MHLSPSCKGDMWLLYPQCFHLRREASTIPLMALQREPSIIISHLWGSSIRKTSATLRFRLLVRMRLTLECFTVSRWRSNTSSRCWTRCTLGREWWKNLWIRSKFALCINMLDGFWDYWRWCRPNSMIGCGSTLTTPTTMPSKPSTTRKLKNSRRRLNDLQKNHKY